MANRTTQTVVSFASSFELPDVDAAGWLAERRSMLRDRYLELGLIGVQRLGAKTPDRLLRRLSDEAPYDEQLVRAHMIARRSSTAGVRAIYEAFADRLRRDLSTERHQTQPAKIGAGAGRDGSKAQVVEMPAHEPPVMLAGRVK